MFIKFLGLIAVFLFSFHLGASEISHLRWDTMIPDQCHENKVSDFMANDLEYFTYSRTGAVRRGFDKEYKIDRDVIRKLWGAFKNNSHDSPEIIHWVRSKPEIERAYTAIKKNYQAMDFDFNEEGQVLELLAIVELKKEIDLSRYYVTGSVAYQGDSEGRRIGELDVVIADVSTCKAIMVGEVKVNPKRLSKARSQLARFRRFIDSEKMRYLSFEKE